LAGETAMLRFRVLLAFICVVALTVLLGPAGYGQGKKSFGGGGPFGGGGQSPGGQPGGGGKAGRDPNWMFNMVAKGADIIVISEVQGPFQQQLAEFAVFQG